MKLPFTVIAMAAVAGLLGGCEAEKQGSFGENYIGDRLASGGVVSARPEGLEPDGDGGGRHGRRRR